jgi:acetolactate synthase-1/2/3 large subunit
MKLTGAEILCETLARLGVRHIFGYPGGAILPVYDALGKSKLHHILVRHEQGATHMADGYARASGGVGVAMATSGPGATNMVTGIATAMLDSSPVVCITGQVSSKLLGSDAFQEVDITGITMPITKHNVVVAKVEDIARTVREAFVIANSGRPGPVLVDITKDAQQASMEFDWDATAPQIPAKRVRMNHDQEEFNRAVELLNTANAPGDSGRTRNRAFRRDAHVREVCTHQQHSSGHDAAWHRLLPCFRSAEPRHDGHAWRSVGEHRDSGSRSADRRGHAF